MTSSRKTWLAKAAVAMASPCPSAHSQVCARGRIDRLPLSRMWTAWPLSWHPLHCTDPWRFLTCGHLLTLCLAERPSPLAVTCEDHLSHGRSRPAHCLRSAGPRARPANDAATPRRQCVWSACASGAVRLMHACGNVRPLPPAPPSLGRTPRPKFFRSSLTQDCATHAAPRFQGRGGRRGAMARSSNQLFGLKALPFLAMIGFGSWGLSQFLKLPTQLKDEQRVRRKQGREKFSLQQEQEVRRRVPAAQRRPFARSRSVARPRSGWRCAWKRRPRTTKMCGCQGLVLRTASRPTEGTAAWLFEGRLDMEADGCVARPSRSVDPREARLRLHQRARVPGKALPARVCVRPGSL